MADPHFEDQLDSLFETVPVFGDVDQFAARIDVRLDRQDLRRRLALSIAAVFGGAVALAEGVTSGVGQRLPVLARSGAGLVQGIEERVQGSLSLTRALHGLSVGAQALRTLSTGAEMHWVLLAGAVLATVVAVQSSEVA